MQLLVRVGSGAEEPDQLGYAHYAEHLAFEGSENFPAKEIERMTSEHTQLCEDYKLNLDNVIQSADINTVNQHLNNMLSSSYGMFVGHRS